MTRYKLKELKNTSFHEQNIQQAVHAQLQQKKAKRYYHIPILSAIISVAIIFFVVSQLVPSTNKHQTAQTPTLLNVFYEIDGAGLAL